MKSKRTTIKKVINKNILPPSRLISVDGEGSNYRLVIEFGELPERTNNSYKNNYRALHRQRSRWKLAVLRLVYHVRPLKPLTSARLILTRFSSVEPDFDGLVSSFKPLLDGLKEGGIILDDKRKVIGQPEYLWELAKRGEGKVTIEVRSS